MICASVSFTKRLKVAFLGQRKKIQERQKRRCSVTWVQAGREKRVCQTNAFPRQQGLVLVLIRDEWLRLPWRDRRCHR